MKAEFQTRASVGSSKRRATRPIAWLAVVAMLTLAILGGVSGEAQARQQKSDALYSMKLGVIAGQADPMLWTLIQGGYFLRAGLDVTIVPFDSGPPQIAAMRTGGIDAAVVAGSPAISMAAQGIPIRIFATTSDSSAVQAIATKPNSGITKIADLKGKKVGFIAGSILEYFMSLALQTAGLQLSDVTPVQTPVALMVPAYNSGSVDALTAVQTPFLKILSSGARVLLRPNQIPGAGIVGQAMFVARDSYATDHPVALNRFVRAISLTQSALAARPSIGWGVVRNRLGLSAKEATYLMTVYKRMRITPTQLASPKYAYNLTNGGMAQQLQPVVAFMKGYSQIPNSFTSMAPFIDGRAVKVVAAAEKAAAKKKKKT